MVHASLVTDLSEQHSPLETMLSCLLNLTTVACASYKWNDLEFIHLSSKFCLREMPQVYHREKTLYKGNVTAHYGYPNTQVQILQQQGCGELFIVL